MNPRRLLAAGVAALVLVAAALVLEVALPRWQRARAERQSILWSGRTPFGPFTIERAGQTWRFEPRPDGSWALRVSGMLRELTADIRSVQDMEKALSGFGGIKTVLAADASRVDLQQYGLDKPRAVLRWTDDWGRARSLALGNVLPGGDSIGAITEDHRLVLLPREILEATDRDLPIFRAKTVVRIDKWQDIRRLEILRRREFPPGASERIVLERDERPQAGEDAWIVKAAKEVPAHPSRITSLISKLSALTAGGFGAENPSPAELAAAGLAPPAVTVVISLAKGPPITLDFGHAAEDKMVWCWDRSGPIVEVREDVRADLMLADEFYRDNRVMRLPRWGLRSLRLLKGTAKTLILEVQKDEKRGWHPVKPQDVDVPQDDVGAVLDALDEIRCGRFEDELAQEPNVVDQRWDFSAPGSLRIEATGELPDKSPMRVDLDATLFLRKGIVYNAVRTTDQAGHEEICIVDMKAFDSFVNHAQRVAAKAGGPPVPSPIPGPPEHQ